MTITSSSSDKEANQITIDEDRLIAEHVRDNGAKQWIDLTKLIPGKSSKQCRERWYNHLDPERKTGDWCESEIRAILDGHRRYGSRWVEISKSVPGRNDNTIKNLWNSCMKVRIEIYLLATYGPRRCVQDPFDGRYELGDDDIDRLSIILSNSSSSSSPQAIFDNALAAAEISFLSPRGVQSTASLEPDPISGIEAAINSPDESYRSGATAHEATGGAGVESIPEGVSAKWTPVEDDKLRISVSQNRDWESVAEEIGGGRTPSSCKTRWKEFISMHASSQAGFTGFVPSQDRVITDHVKIFGARRWIDLTKLIPGKSSKQCRERWYNHLDPERKTGDWCESEIRAILDGHRRYGSRWVEISKSVPGRNDNTIKNLWNSCMRAVIEKYLGETKQGTAASPSAIQLTHLTDKQISELTAEVMTKRMERQSRATPQAQSVLRRIAHVDTRDIASPKLPQPRKRKVLNADDVDPYVHTTFVQENK